VASEVKLPRLGQGMEAGTIVKWLKAEGDRVEKGEPLYELDTDKVTQEVEAEASGVLLKIAVTEGEVPVGETVAVIGERGEAVPDTSGARHRDTAETDKPQDDGPRSAEKPAIAAERESDRERGRKAAADAAASAEDTTGARYGLQDRKPNERVKASPLARRMARERDLDLGAIRGTGPDGRIVAEDVERAEVSAPQRAAAPTTAPGDVESVPLTSIRKTIARRLTEAWTIPVFQLTVSADMTRANELVARAREVDADVKVTVTDVLAKVCAQALRRHPDVNVQYAEDALLRFPNANVGIAVAAPQGLVVPVIRAVEQLPLHELARARADAVARARDNKLTRDDLEGGTFTISNLGMFGVEQFTAVLNPPQAAILAVGATEERVVVRDGELTPRPMLTVTLTVDHRAVDGGPAAQFLQTVKTYLEEPGLAL
jgi:pyruvate dehydrogenase E2 component (dihydrolipoyllysine-residue acetyltransferase)